MKHHRGKPAVHATGTEGLQTAERSAPSAGSRRTSLDELPQFFNVLRGEMSLVGPRPPIPYETEVYDIWHRRRFFEVKPGITGLWQVKGRSRVTFDGWSGWMSVHAKLIAGLDLRFSSKPPSRLFGKGANRHRDQVSVQRSAEVLRLAITISLQRDSARNARSALSLREKYAGVFRIRTRSAGRNYVTSAG
jgi:hypothetical protein